MTANYRSSSGGLIHACACTDLDTYKWIYTQNTESPLTLTKAKIVHLLQKKF